MKFLKNQKYSYQNLSNAIRILATDAIEKAGSGHPGMPMGMADIMTSLVFDFLKFNPNDPTWLNRDRLIVSNGHGSMLLYAFYYLAGYKDFTIHDIKNFRQLHSKAPGHPEYGVYSAIETTTGPLGQGLANAVGMAIAQKKYEHQVGRDVCSYKIYCTVGDGCLMEGISYEASSIAGHLKLNNLIVLFDDNQISIDGKTSLSVSEDHLKKFSAFGWNVESIDGHDFTQIHASLSRAQNSDKPYFIACRTSIAKGAVTKAGSEYAHGAPLGAEEVKLMKEAFGVKNEPFYIPQEVKSAWESAWEVNAQTYNKWIDRFNALTSDKNTYLSEINIELSTLSTIKPPQNNEATRASFGRIIRELIRTNNKIICGSADLSLSNNMKNDLNKIITKDDFSGNYIHYGVRENAMAAIMNGLALSGFLPIGGSFFVFSDYMKPGIRLSAVMNQRVIYIMTHDSIGVGEDGPTHQPIEHLAGLRAMPNLLVLRPADFMETLECIRIALAYQSGPSMLVLTRQPVRQIRNSEVEDNLSAKGAYIIPYLHSNDTLYDVTIFATGSEVSIAIDVAEILKASNLVIRVVSIPCFELFFQQGQKYIRSILDKSTLKVAIEAGSSFGWHRIIGEGGMFFGIDKFGLSATASDLYEYFGLTAQNIADKVLKRI
jgi:transketolase